MQAQGCVRTLKAATPARFTAKASVRPSAPVVARSAAVVPQVKIAGVQRSAQTLRRDDSARVLSRTLVKTRAADSVGAASTEEGGMFSKENMITIGWICLWYAFNVGFNLQNKSLYGIFRFPWTVSAIHVGVGTIYCCFMWLIGQKDKSYGRAITKEEFGFLWKPALMHALGHCAANLSFAAVAISLSHTVKTLEPAFNVILGQVVLGTVTPWPVILSLLPIIGGVGMASAAELSFNWFGFNSAMLSNLTFSLRACWVKLAQGKVTNFSQTNNYSWTALFSCFVCIPLAIIFEGSTVVAGAEAAIAKVGMQSFVLQLINVGMLYHLYNQFAYSTLGRVNPVGHGVCNVVKRIIIIFSSVIFFNQTLTLQTKIGTAIAIFGTYLYSEMSARYKK